LGTATPVVKKSGENSTGADLRYPVTREGLQKQNHPEGAGKKNGQRSSRASEGNGAKGGTEKPCRGGFLPGCALKKKGRGGGGFFKSNEGGVERKAEKRKKKKKKALNPVRTTNFQIEKGGRIGIHKAGWGGNSKRPHEKGLLKGRIPKDPKERR